MNQSTKHVFPNFGELSEEYSIDKNRVDKVIHRLEKDFENLTIQIPASSDITDWGEYAEIISSTLSKETKARISPYTNEILDRLGKNQSLKEISQDLANRLVISNVEVLKFISLIDSIGRAWDQQQKEKRELIKPLVIFVLADSQLVQRQDELDTISNKCPATRVPEEVKDKCERHGTELRNYLLFLDELIAKNKLWPSDPRDAAWRGEQMGKMFSGLMLVSVAIGLEFGSRPLNKESVGDVVQLLRIACQYMVNFVSVAFAKLAEGKSETEINDLGELGQLGWRLTRMLSVESCIEGFHLSQDRPKIKETSFHDS